MLDGGLLKDGTVTGGRGAAVFRHVSSQWEAVQSVRRRVRCGLPSTVDGVEVLLQVLGVGDGIVDRRPDDVELVEQGLGRGEAGGVELDVVAEVGVGGPLVLGGDEGLGGRVADVLVVLELAGRVDEAVDGGDVVEPVLDGAGYFLLRSGVHVSVGVGVVTTTSGGGGGGVVIVAVLGHRVGQDGGAHDENDTGGALHLEIINEFGIRRDT